MGGFDDGVDFTLDLDWWPSLDLVEAPMDGGLYFTIELGAKKFKLDLVDMVDVMDLAWSPQWAAASTSPSSWAPRSSLDFRWTGARTGRRAQIHPPLGRREVPWIQDGLEPA